jgi:hypothetical protein
LALLELGEGDPGDPATCRRVAKPLDEEAISVSRLARYTELCAVLPARPGIREWIVEAHGLGLRLGVATNDDTGRATRHLARLGLDRFLETVVVLEPGMAVSRRRILYRQAPALLVSTPSRLLLWRIPRTGWRPRTGRG